LKQSNQESRISLWDTWGLTYATYKGDEIKLLLDGMLPEEWEMREILMNKQDEIKQCEDTKHLRKIHAVLFFIPASVLTDPNVDKARKIIQTTFQELIQNKYNPILVLAQVDQVCKGLRDPVGKHKGIEELREKAQQLFKIPLVNITYVFNYPTESKNFRN